ncbi:M14 family metallopeptidase [Nibrella saemangeumensis]|uniref:M14 family metallopeptidase n=1 Tax=Nibrella saemangeumensis TaxID=1084526 RepID=A0ABP8N7A8_9BACT
MKKNALFFLFSFITCSAWAQSGLPSPAQFLGYPVGSKFTPHYRVIAYAEHIARQAPNQVKFLPYGTTFEGRPLVAVVVASEANLSRVEEIRTNNLKRIGLLDGQPTTTPQPPIAWLSYNVHGNEAVSSEAFMEVLYGLLQSSDPVAQKILKNTVVILDPGLNPDGHDRYVNWYNQMVGRNPNPTPFAREHQEPWPGGRFTHYIFDPNRDWAWQTQEVTQQRMALYHQWMPQLHGDFHEMGPESPYYFAPSAKPFHEDITPWQRQFQDIIGQYNTRYFDRNNWLYYTRERFDLFYPSYGDTWPTYNGAIGMTFEQGGGGRAGLALEKNDGDTLTLRERIDHHVAASMATLESVADRPDQVVKEFVSYFEKSRSNPIGAYKSYVIKANGDEGRMKALRQLLDRNQIRYGYAGKSVTAPGFNYASQKNEKNISVAPADLVISAYQPKSTLLKILFEPTSKLEDSVTYDITAWSIPYAFGVGTYGLTSRIDPVANPPKAAVTVTPSVSKPYAYVARWQSLPSVQLLAGLLKQKVRVRAAEKEFEVNGQTYPSGSLIITRSGNERLGDRLDAIVQQAATEAGIRATPIASGFVTKGSDLGSGSVLSLKSPRVGVVVGDGTSPTDAGEVWYYFDQELNYPVTLIDGQTLANVDWRKLDVLILPSGSYSRILTDRTLTSIKDWVRSGGKLIALERAAAFLAGKPDFALKEKEDADDKSKGRLAGTTGRKTNPADSLKLYGDRERSAISDETPGSIYRLNLDTTHPLAFGLTNGYYALIQDAYNFDFLKSGWNVGYLKDDNYVAGFAGRNAKEKLKNTLIMGEQTLGRGSIIYLANDPLFRGFWYNGKLLFGNAVFMTGNQ